MKNLRVTLIGFLCLSSGTVSLAQEPVGSLNELLRDINGSLRLSVKEFNGTDLLSEQPFNKELLQTKTGNWSMQFKASPVSKHPGVMDVSTSFRLNSGVAKSSAVSVSFDFSKWNPENYVLVPASVYNGNRYRAIGNSYSPQYPKDMYYNPSVPLTISNNPRLSIESNKASLVELTTGNVATPALCFFSKRNKKDLLYLLSK
ncbi:hypothetical protein [Pedobacter panaciterrae]